MTTTQLETICRVWLRQEIADRRALASHARRRGLRIARIWHIVKATDARRKLRNLPKP